MSEEQGKEGQESDLQQIEGYREMMLHTFAEAIKLVADGAVVAQAEYSPQRIHAMTIEAMQRARSAARDDKARIRELEAALAWLESKNTLHQSVNLLYVVDGYLVEVVRDGELPEQYSGETLLNAINAAISSSLVARDEEEHSICPECGFKTYHVKDGELQHEHGCSQEFSSPVAQGGTE